MEGSRRGNILLFCDLKRKLSHIKRRMNVNYIVVLLHYLFIELLVLGRSAVLHRKHGEVHASATDNLVRLVVFIMPVSGRNGGNVRFLAAVLTVVVHTVNNAVNVRKVGIHSV